jgi:hypothetical protein
MLMSRVWSLGPGADQRLSVQSRVRWVCPDRIPCTGAYAQPYILEGNGSTCYTVSGSFLGVTLHHLAVADNADQLPLKSSATALSWPSGVVCRYCAFPAFAFSWCPSHVTTPTVCRVGLPCRPMLIHVRGAWWPLSRCVTPRVWLYAQSGWHGLVGAREPSSSRA